MTKRETPPYSPPTDVGGEETVTHSPEETLEWGADFARRLKAGDVVALDGELGAGKTVVTKGICRGLGYEGEVTSPSFVRVHRYTPTIPQSGIRNQQSAIIHHADFYLLRNLNEVMDLGLDELYGGDNIVLVEWAQRFPDAIPKGAWWIKMELGKAETDRIIHISKRISE